MKKTLFGCLSAVLFLIISSGNSFGVTNFYYSVDIGSDLEMSDPNSPGPLDPGDIYTNGMPIKDDLQIFQPQIGGDPAPDPNNPASAVPVGQQGTGSDDYEGYFDLDGEDQLPVSIIVSNSEGVQIDAENVPGLWKNPSDIYISFDDDGAPGWPLNDVPVTVPPTHGTTSAHDEILTGNVWRVWSPLSGAIDEMGLGLAPNPDQGDADDDDVDALDVEQHQYWYWTCDHEADMGLDPGAIYVTDRGGVGYTVSISSALLGIQQGPQNVTDVDAFEFCTTDDTNILQQFGLPPGEYLAVVFSVDQDDSVTLTDDESGGLNPNQLYISLLTGAPPLPLTQENYSGDIDAIAFSGDNTPQGESLDFGDAPDSAQVPRYPTLLSNNGARHKIGGPYLGPVTDVPDAETDGLPDPNALGDDNNNINDENGVWFKQLPMPMVRGVADTLTLIVNGGGGKVQLWVDWNNDGDWSDPGEYIIQNAGYTNGTYTVAVTAPTNAFVGQTFSRCRISTAGGLGVGGLAADGEVEDNPVWIDSGKVDWCNLQWPHSITTNAGVATENIYGWVYQSNVTDAAGQGLGITAQVGYGPDGTDPTTNASLWTWTTATYNMDKGNSDEYMATITVAATGRYDYAYRYSRNGVDWSYGDLDGSSNGYSVAQAGDLIVQGGGQENPVTECSKWKQPPDCEFGLDLPDYSVALPDSTSQVYRLADDWWCDGRPITAIRWWGSYLSNTELIPPANRPVKFVLRWYTDAPSNAVMPVAHPGNIIKEIVVPLAAFGITNVPEDIVSEQYYCTVSNKVEFPGYENEYEYKVELSDPWVEKEGNVYWLNIEAIYDAANGPVSNEWGWATSSKFDLLSDAVVWDDSLGMPPETWHELTWPEFPYIHLFNTGLGYSPFLEPDNEPSLDLAFEMITDVCPGRCKKWSQPVDLDFSRDLESWRREGESSGFILRADDWICDGRPISDIHWWGSYIGWMSNVVGSVTNPVPWPTNADARIIGFDLSWHLNDTNTCTPIVPAITNIFVPIEDCYQVYYGSIKTGPGTWEHEYQYYVDLLDVDAPWNEVKDEHYWLNIQAVLPATYNVQEPSGYNGWGWAGLPWPLICSSAYSTDGTNWISTDVTDPMDLAFELTTTDMPSTNSQWYNPVKFVDIGMETNGMGWMVSSGGCACAEQVLQFSSNLLDNPVNWIDLSTNMTWWPHEYIWYDYFGTNIGFYRIIQRNNP